MMKFWNNFTQKQNPASTQAILARQKESEEKIDFEASKPSFQYCVVIHLKTGKIVAGKVNNQHSLLSKFDYSRERIGLFLSVILKVNDEGVLVQENNLPVPVNFSRGLYIPADSYDYLEFFEFEEK